MDRAAPWLRGVEEVGAYRGQVAVLEAEAVRAGGYRRGTHDEFDLDDSGAAAQFKVGRLVESQHDLLAPNRSLKVAMSFITH